jgi:hypothetical protein
LHPLSAEWSRTAGLGDITLERFLAPNWKPWLIFGVAPTLIVPTATDTHLGQGKVQFGPAVVLGFLTKNWIGGVFVQNWWSVTGSNSKPAVNQMNLQYFLYRMLPDAWQMGAAQPQSGPQLCLAQLLFYLAWLSPVGTWEIA